MKTGAKPMVAMAFGAILLPGLLCQTAQAQSTLIESGSSALADVYGISTAPEALNVSWFVVENNVSDVYTYEYTVNNPPGDVELNGGGSPTTTPETFNSFTITFNTTLPGAYLSGAAPVGGTVVNNGPTGLTWNLADVDPGGNSGILAFQSDLAPGLNNASAGGGAVGPSPWSTIPSGQPVPVPVPRGIPEPVTTDLFALTALMLLPFSSTWRGLIRKGWDSHR
jgi:hypothetical protein